MIIIGILHFILFDLLTVARNLATLPKRVITKAKLLILIMSKKPMCFWSGFV